MSICKDCLHNEVCKYGENRSNGMFCTGEKCKQYKPTADVVEVVRCKDCTEWDEESQECSHWYGFRADDYCSYGERREENER